MALVPQGETNAQLIGATKDPSHFRYNQTLSFHDTSSHRITIPSQLIQAQHYTVAKTAVPIVIQCHFGPFLSVSQNGI